MADNTMATAMRQRPDELGGLLIDQNVMFSNHKGAHSPSLERRQRKLLPKISSFIKPYLAQDEQISLVTTCCSPLTWIEQLTGGWIMFYIKRALLVFTNRRILHVPTRINYTYRNSIAQILYGDCASLALRGHSLMVTYRSGKKGKFLLVARQERRKISSMLSQLRLEGTPSEAKERTHLCPSCTSPLRKDVYACPRCHMGFKEYNEAKRVSILYPGGGYFYTGHPWLGIGDAAAEAVLLLATLLSFWEWLMGSEEAFLDFLVWGTFLALEKAITVYHSLHFINEYIPKEKNVRLHPAT